MALNNMISRSTPAKGMLGFMLASTMFLAGCDRDKPEVITPEQITNSANLNKISFINDPNGLPSGKMIITALDQNGILYEATVMPTMDGSQNANVYFENSNVVGTQSKLSEKSYNWVSVDNLNPTTLHIDVYPGKENKTMGGSRIQMSLAANAKIIVGGDTDEVLNSYAENVQGALMHVVNSTTAMYGKNRGDGNLQTAQVVIKRVNAANYK